ncbi:MAG: metallophosphoesterase, partial [Vicinamibacterales bacterium]
MRLWAISDLHVGYEENRRAVEAAPAFPDDWLILAGDTGETPAHLDFVLRSLEPKFAQIIWTPGNHDLWTPKTLPSGQRGAAHYDRLVALCRRYGVFTPEDPYPKWPGDGPLRAVVPTFTLFDYSFRPVHVTRENAIDWAADAGIRSADEDLLAPDPYSNCDE